MSFVGMHMQRAWHLINAENQVVGRLACQVATLLKGKHKPTFTPNKDMGDHVVIVNAEKVHFTGKSWNRKIYYWHSGYPGGLKQRTAKQILDRHPTRIIERAILGMLENNRLRRQFIQKRLFIYTGPNHPHTAELPPSVPPLAAVPRSLKRVNFATNGLDHYAHPNSFQWNPYIPKYKTRIPINRHKFLKEQEQWAKEQKEAEVTRRVERKAAREKRRLAKEGAAANASNAAERKA
ncbi:hypothetical protein ACA910_007281 [Epithemia clementina (nom. ined.)]